MKTPKSPDYTAAAAQQGTEDRQTAEFNANLNRVNESNLLGTRSWSVGPDGRWTVTDTPSEAEKSKYDLQTKAELGMLGGLNDAIPQMVQAIQGDYSLPGSPLQGFDPRYAPTQGLQYNIDTRGMSRMPTADTRSRQVVSDAIYRMAKARLDPQYQQLESGITNQLRNEGILPGSEAYSRAMDQLSRDRTSAYGDARDRAITGGGEEMSRDFGMGMSRNAQDFGQRQSLAQFANSAVGQGFDISALATQLANSGRAQSLQELISSKTLPVNVLTGLMSGTQVNLPQFQTYNNQITAQPAPYYSAAKDQGAFNTSSANAQNAFYGSMASALTKPFSFSFGS